MSIYDLYPFLIPVRWVKDRIDKLAADMKYSKTQTIDIIRTEIEEKPWEDSRHTAFTKPVSVPKVTIK